MITQDPEYGPVSVSPSLPCVTASRFRRASLAALSLIGIAYFSMPSWGANDDGTCRAYVDRNDPQRVLLREFATGAYLAALGNNAENAFPALQSVFLAVIESKCIERPEASAREIALEQALKLSSPKQPAPKKPMTEQSANTGSEPVGFPYDCKTMTPEIIAATEANRGGLVNVFLLSIQKPEELSRSSRRLECKGLGIWSDTSQGDLRFFAYEQNGEWFLQYEPF